jgi:hypothetical protein
MNGSLFWDVKPCTVATSTGMLLRLLHAGFLLGLLFDPEDGRDVPPKRCSVFAGLYGVSSQNRTFDELIYIYIYIYIF